MKKLLLSASVLLMATGAFAQTTTMTGSDARFGIKAGVNLARFHTSGGNNEAFNDNVKDNVGFNVTAFADFGVGNNFFIQPGISLQNKGAKFESTNVVTAANITTTTISSNKTSLMTIEVPVNAVFRIPTGDAGAIQISAGPYIGFNVSGKNKLESTATAVNNTNNSSSTITSSGENDLSFGSATDKNYGSTEFGANFGLAYRLNSGISVGANYGLGLTDLTPKDRRANNNDNKLTNRVLGFSVGYSF
ncbi:outer membrane beta-barrel protein [Pedobacter petrophilus]|uniref:Outer membrane beta-barrel protein n=1 Tax=Pedobacter petrophilus TaxID=1908241 RepID=A0A7K0FUI1_9SPHI|nr:outer membrane beta-barrel protein [Pedobacter petrophilus]MRX74870.1 outer membrane beta-barrel protein [Pedobacter petrophilus]